MTHHRRTRRAVTVGLASAGLVLSTASAVTAHDGSHDYLTQTRSTVSKDDAGGVDAKASLYVRGTDPDEESHYFVRFIAYGEVLHLKDDHTDGRRAQAEVVVYDKSGKVLDRDLALFTSTYQRFNLGTPDGTGDIKEGLYVKIRVRPEGGTWSRWAYGTA